MFDLIPLIKTAGYLGLFGIIFAESGLFVGFFFPGDSLLFTAGFLASQGYMNFWLLILVTFLGAVLGVSVGYWFGYRVGPKIFKKEDSLLFHKDHLEKTRLFYERHGGKAMILARFMPIVRTFAPIMAGVGRMYYPTFLFYNIIGGILWAIGVTALGFLLGNVVPNADRYLLPIILLIIIVSTAPCVFHIFKDKERRQYIAGMIKMKLHLANLRIK